MTPNIPTVSSDTAAQENADFRHEINNLLFVIVGSAESALKRTRRNAQYGAPEAEATIADLQRILLSVERAQQAVLKFTRSGEASESSSADTP